MMILGREAIWYNVTSTISRIRESTQIQINFFLFGTLSIAVLR